MHVWNQCLAVVSYRDPRGALQLNTIRVAYSTDIFQGATSTLERFEFNKETSIKEEENLSAWLVDFIEEHGMEEAQALLEGGGSLKISK
jgi:hypothetical protein